MRLPPWHLHPEAWLLALALEGLYLWALSRVGPHSVPEGQGPATRGQMWSFTLGVAALLAASVWPIHDLSERYLFSIHMVQHLMISLVAPPLLLYGTPAWLLRKLVAPGPVNWFVRNFARPFVALVVFNTVIVVTHWPPVVELVLYHHSYHFLFHTILFVAATMMWWPVISPLPEMPTLSYPWRMLYLFLQSIVPTVPASFLTFGSKPLYSFYEHAPRIWGMSALTDQRIAGLTMKLVGGLILWSVIAVIFFKWYLVEQRDGWDELQWRDVEREIRSEMSRGHR